VQSNSAALRPLVPVHALQHDRRAVDDVLHLLFLVVSEKQRRIGRKRFEVFESCRQFIYGVWRDVSTRPDGSILKGPQCGEGFHLSSLKQLREFLGVGLAG
jgi:hypothetical protein